MPYHRDECPRDRQHSWPRDPREYVRPGLLEQQVLSVRQGVVPRDPHLQTPRDWHWETSCDPQGNTQGDRQEGGLADPRVDLGRPNHQAEAAPSRAAAALPDLQVTVPREQMAKPVCDEQAKEAPGQLVERVSRDHRRAPPQDQQGGNTPLDRL